MKKIILFIALNATAIFLLAQNQIKLPEELKKYSDHQQVLQNMIGDTISFDFVRLNNETLEYTKYNPEELKNIYRTDTIWKRKIKDIKKAKLNKHYTIVKTFKRPDEISKGKFKVLNIKYRDNSSRLSNTTSLNSYERNILSEYIDIYLLDIANRDTITWSHAQLNKTSNPEFQIKIDKIERLLNSFMLGKDMYFYTGYKYGDSEYSAKNDYRNYIQLTCTKCNYLFDGRTLVGAFYAFVFSDSTGKEYHFDIENLNNKNNMITATHYEEIKHSTIQSLKQKGRYNYILSKIEKPKNSSIRFGEYKEIKTNDDVSKFLYKDNVVSILWFGDKTQFSFSLKNNSSHSLKIIWDEASFINDKNESSRIIHKGIRYIDANNPQAPTIIPKGTELNDIIAPVDRIRYRDGYFLVELVEGSFRYDPLLEGKHVKILLPIEIQGIVNEYIFTFEMHWKYDYPDLQYK